MFWAAYYDPIYLILMVFTLALSLIVNLFVKSTYAKQSKVPSSRGYTGAQVAEYILSQNGIYDVTVETVQGKLTDHYDPTASVIRLSREVYSGTSVAALGVAAHEAGHAVQHATRYAPLILKNTLVPVARFGSSFTYVLIILGFVMNLTGLVWLGILIFALSVLLTLITLPVEFNASRRAVSALRQGDFLYGEELSGAKRVLTAAALTYVAAFITAALNLLYLIMRYGRRGR